MTSGIHDGRPGPIRKDPTGEASGKDWITIARIARPQGLRGELVADILTDFPDRFDALDRFFLRLSTGQLVERQLEWSRPHKDRIVLKLRGADRIEDVESYRGAAVLIERSQLVPLPPDNYYDFDLVGCQVETRQAVPVGRVIGVEHYGAAPLLVVSAPDEREHLIPLAAAICVEVDIQARRIVVEPPEGLLD